MVIEIPVSSQRLPLYLDQVPQLASQGRMTYTHYNYEKLYGQNGKKLRYPKKLTASKSSRFLLSYRGFCVQRPKKATKSLSFQADVSTSLPSPSFRGSLREVPPALWNEGIVLS
ncbi:hypothetical protein PGT21_022853 [Puccinia graminis f. sp. tritici]|uniref:Uncharacterized protein n=1 Tax=Puccinia graminis f. sp. tritici TaxID=56615 RepID=A0A5B0MVE0_PUCGR|nr:hypothetical protein PGT21_022853 [Puccinia graminis f. sp. tritici]